MNWKFWKKEPPQISEPVFSLLAALRCTENWNVERDSCGIISSVVLEHKHKEIRLTFYWYRSEYWRPQCSWMTEDERLFVGKEFVSINEMFKVCSADKERQRIAKELGV